MKSLNIKAVLSLFLCSLIRVPALAADSAPPWLQTAAQQTLPHVDKDVPAIVLLDEGTAMLNEKGQLIKHERIAIKILTKEGKGFTAQSVRYNNDSKVTDFIGWHIPPDGKVRKSNKSDIADVGLSEEAYTDERKKLLLFSDAQPGSILGWEWETIETPYVFQDEWEFQGYRIPIALSRYTITVPTGWEVRGLMANHAPIKPSGAANSYTWELRDLPAIKDEPSMPDLPNVSPWLMASFFPPTSVSGPNRSVGSWRDLSRWYDDLASAQVQVDDSITSKAKEITSNKNSQLDKVRAIATWMQKNIRYVDIEVGIGGFKPHPSTSTLRNSYGDCKDKVTLMRALLKASGIDSYFVPIYSGDRNRVLPDLPGHQFNHVIVAVAVDDALPSTLQVPSVGKLLFFDPTDSITPIGDLPYYLQGSYGLLVKGAEGDLIKMPETGEEMNKVSRAGTVKLQGDGSIDVSVVRTMTGQAGQIQRHLFKEMGPEKYRKRIEQIIAEDIPGVAFKSLKIADEDAPEKPLSVLYEMRATNYASAMGKLLMFKPTVIGRSEEIHYRKENREYPVDLAMTEAIEDNLTIELPAGFKIDELPDPEKLSTDFGQFETSYKVEGQILHFHRRLAVKGVRVPKEKYPELKKFFEHVYASDQASVVLTKQ